VLDLLKQHPRTTAATVAGTLALAVLPFFTSGYLISLFLLLYANVALATAWSFFSGATR
jgi:hypothetical protein